MKSKVLINKKLKYENLMSSALELFSTNDFQDVTIENIVQKAGVAKGTFYLYFKDKYQIQNALIQKESTKLFTAAYDKLTIENITGFEDRVIFLINEVLESLESNPFILRFIKRNLSWGMFQNNMNEMIEEDRYNIVDEFVKDAQNGGYHFSDPNTVLYIIIEMTSSTCYTSILYKTPLPIKEFKPYLFQSIRAILQQGKI